MIQEAAFRKETDYILLSNGTLEMYNVGLFDRKLVIKCLFLL